MGHHMVFMLIVFLFVGLDEAHEKNRIIVNNQLGSGPSGIPLYYLCRSTYSEYTGTQKLTDFNSNWTVDFEESLFHNRLVWLCDLSFRTDKEYYFKELQVYRAASEIRWGQLRQWTCRIDGIYFTRDYNEPVGRVLDWKSTNL
ncbi:hypothetical protein EUTSA_v10002784mg [Eutrema salsugineum]|uniref:Uncharacterized protein n=1 Tax=Eutrema salsugineum TaxID=72664 RepID=V4L472_EUTSA|nr:hypothetical protein EUTSA_v10002784mg [Eutrema salsugineum]